VSAPILEVRDLSVSFHTDDGVVRAVRGVSWSLAEGEALALVGESGSGKTVSALSVMGLVPEPAGRVEGGRILFHGRDLLGLSPGGWREVRGRRIAMVFQDPMTSLNPVLTVERQLTEGLRHHMGMSPVDARDRSVELLELVGIPDARQRLADYPHRFSGGQRQRLMIAMALACEPAVLIADEPTTALDVTIQAQIVDLVKDLRDRLGMAILWITHDLALVAGLVDRVAVMYAGEIVETAPVDRLYAHPSHPYTRGLLRSMPGAEGGTGSDGRPGRLHAIPGRPPDLRAVPAGCPFAPRCEHAEDACRETPQRLEEVAPGHQSACMRRMELPAWTPGGGL
jgi:oligopeptide transport system ATP-binding protein